MAKKKEEERIVLKKYTANFNLVGRAKVGDYTFKLEVESQKEDSDWVYNQMNLAVDCGEEYGAISADLMGGYGKDRDNVVYVHGKKKNEKTDKYEDDFKNRFTIDWDDREDEEVLEEVGDLCFITVGLEKDGNKTIYKKFVTQYDAIDYINEKLEDNMVISVKGSLVWSLYNDELQVKKEVSSIVLSKAEEKDFKAVFTQPILLAKDCIGKFDKETMTIPITCRIIEYFKTYNNQEVKTMLPIYKVFDMKIDGEDKEKANKMLKQFNVSKAKDINLLVVDGYFSKGEVNMVGISEEDIPDDILELIEMGYMTKESILEKMAFANGAGNKKEKMYIKSPHIKFVGEDVKMPVIDKVAKIYTEDEVDIHLILESLGVKDALDEALEDNEEANEEDEEDWLADL